MLDGTVSEATSHVTMYMHVAYMYMMYVVYDVRMTIHIRMSTYIVCADQYVCVVCVCAVCTFFLIRRVHEGGAKEG